MSGLAGRGYGLAACELVLAPFMPSNTARGGGIVHPVMKSIAQAFGSDPEQGTERRVGTYLALVNYHANPITSAMFLTATAPNPLVVDAVAKATGQQLHLSWGTWAACTALVGMGPLLTGTLDWDDVLAEKSAWDTLIWFGALVMTASQLNKAGVIAWFSEGLRHAIVAAGLGWPATAAVLVGVFVFSHDLFASTTAHIGAMMAAFLTVGAQLLPAGAVAPFMLVMTAGSAIMMTLTHYATGTPPIIFGSGYVSLGLWWRVGLAMCLFELTVFATVGLVWWRLLGYA